jgi:hypothetical protein
MVSPQGGWPETRGIVRQRGCIFAGEVLAAAIPDRLLGFSMPINRGGQSCRLREERKAGVFTELAKPD